MKKNKLYIFLLIIILINGLFFGCKKSENDASKSKTTSNGQYSQLLNDYEAWADKYIELVKKLNKDPMNAVKYQKELQEFGQEAGSWLQRWQSIKGTPSKSEQARLDKIAEKVNNALQ